MSLEWQKRREVFDSFSSIGGKLIRRPAVNWRKIQAIDHGLLPAVRSAWTRCKSDLGYATYEDVARALPLKGRLHARVRQVAENLKHFWKRNPVWILMTVDRAGNNIAFKFKSTETRSTTPRGEVRTEPSQPGKAERQDEPSRPVGRAA
jgi:hypothetical protein